MAFTGVDVGNDAIIAGVVVIGVAVVGAFSAGAVVAAVGWTGMAGCA